MYSSNLHKCKGLLGVGSWESSDLLVAAVFGLPADAARPLHDGAGPPAAAAALGHPPALGAAVQHVTSLPVCIGWMDLGFRVACVRVPQPLKFDNHVCGGGLII